MTDDIDHFKQLWDASSLPAMKSSLHHTPFGPTHAISYATLAHQRSRALNSLFSQGLPYSLSLSKHTSCVNALAFSSADARWLASGGDDSFLYLWDLHQDQLESPSRSFTGHKANVFALAFSASNKYLFSGDTDNEIHMYDLTDSPSSTTRWGTPVFSFTRHDNSVRALSCHPQGDELLLSASEDGTIKLHDVRVHTHTAQSTLTAATDFTSVQYHPTMPHLFVTGTQQGDVRLHDVRNAFGRTNGDVPAVHHYITSMSKPSVEALYRPDIGSLTFDKSGTRLAVTALNYFPTIYALMDPHPLATCSGRNAPDGTPIPKGTRTYSNCCTIKHGSFGGMGTETDSYLAVGSDDFRGYIWEIPDVKELERRREMVVHGRWQNFSNPDEGGRAKPDVIGFASGKNAHRYVPVELDTPLCRLGGHKSIVNSALVHPHFPMVFTSGVERHIVLHSPLPSANCAGDLTETPTTVRKLPKQHPEGHRLFIQALLGGRTYDGEDRETIALFDQILRDEGEKDIFDLPTRIWNEDEPEDEPEEETREENARDSDDDLYMNT